MCIFYGMFKKLGSKFIWIQKIYTDTQRMIKRNGLSGKVVDYFMKVLNYVRVVRVYFRIGGRDDADWVFWMFELYTLYKLR